MRLPPIFTPSMKIPNYADALHALAMTYAHQEKVDQAIEIG